MNSEIAIALNGSFYNNKTKDKMHDKILHPGRKNH